MCTSDVHIYPERPVVLSSRSLGDADSKSEDRPQPALGSLLESPWVDMALLLPRTS